MTACFTFKRLIHFKKASINIVQLVHRDFLFLIWNILVHPGCLAPASAVVTLLHLSTGQVGSTSDWVEGKVEWSRHATVVALIWESIFLRSLRYVQSLKHKRTSIGGWICQFKVTTTCLSNIIKQFLSLKMLYWSSNSFVVSSSRLPEAKAEASSFTSSHFSNCSASTVQADSNRSTHLRQEQLKGWRVATVLDRTSI